MWAYESVFYQIYPLGFCGAPFENGGVPDAADPKGHRLDSTHQKSWCECDLFFTGI